MLRDVGTWAALFFPYKERAQRRSRVAAGVAPRELNFKLINLGLIALLVFLVVAIAFNMNRVQPSLKDLSSRVAASRPLTGDEQAVASLRPLADYVGEVEKRDLFHPLLPPKPKEPEPKVAAAKPPESPPLDSLREKAKTLKLVGISWGATPIAMIEDTTRLETSFLKAGQVINQMKVKTVLKDRVILSYGTAEYDLF